MRQASMALMELVPTETSEIPKGRDLGRDARGTDRKSDAERAAATASSPPRGVILYGIRPDFG